MAARTAKSAAGPQLKIEPSVIAASPGHGVQVSVTVSASSLVQHMLYQFDPHTGKLSAVPPAEQDWLTVEPSSAKAAPGRPVVFTIQVGSIASPPAQDTYLDVVFVSRALTQSPGTALQLGAGTVVAFRGTAARPRDWSAGLAGPGILWFGSGAWRLLVRGSAQGWVAPLVQAELGHGRTGAMLPPILPGRQGSAELVFRRVLPGWRDLRVSVSAGGRTVVLERHVVVLPLGLAVGVVVGAVSALIVVALLWLRRLRGVRTDMEGMTVVEKGG